MTNNQQKTILITGAAGFIGNALVNFIIRNNYNYHVICCDKDCYRVSEKEGKGWNQGYNKCEEKDSKGRNQGYDKCLDKQGSNKYQNKNIVWEVIDLRDASAIQRVINSYNIDCLIHLASNTHALHNLNDVYHGLQFIPLLLDHLQHKPCQMIMLGSADQYAYNDHATIKYSENSAKISHNLNSLAKNMEQEFIEYARLTWNLPICLLRPFSVYGENQPNNMFLQSLINSCVLNTEFTMFSLEQVRDFIYVDDVCNAICKIISANSPLNTDYNCGTGIGTTLKEVVTIIKNQIPLTDKFKVIETFNKNSSPYLVADISKISKELNWNPEVKLVDGLNKMINHAKQQTKN